MRGLAVGPGVAVTLHFSLTLEDGTVIDSNFERDPASFVVGDGNMLSGFEEALFGLHAGDEQVFHIPPEKGFGQHNANNVQVIERGQFPEEVDLKPGLMLSFSDAANTELPGVVFEVTDDQVTVDFNHPLAGRVIEFSVKIVDVQPAVTH